MSTREEHSYAVERFWDIVYFVYRYRVKRNRFYYVVGPALIGLSCSSSTDSSAVFHRKIYFNRSFRVT